MAQSRSFFDDVKKELDCSVCQEQFSSTKEPKILKCLHTFCRSCLEAWLARQREGKLSCPTCRQITECPNNDINGLPSNLFYKQLVDIVDAYSGGGQDDSPQCGNCEEKNYLKCYCSRCNCFLCEDCAGIHVKGKLFRGHQVKEIRNFQSSDVQDYARRANVCTKHDDEVRFFCVDCQICICRDCAILEHQDHKKISIDEGLVNSKSEIEAKMSEVQTNDSRLRTHREALEKRRQKVSSDIDEATLEVKRVAACCVLLIRKHEESVLQQLLEQKEALQDSFAAQISSLDGKLTEIESTVAFCEEVLLRKNLPEILNVKTIIEERLRDLSLSSPEDIPKQDYSRVKYVSNDFSFAPGRLITSNTEPSLSVAEGKGVTEGIVGEDCSFTVITKDSTGKDTYSEIDEVQVAITSVSPRHDVTEPVNMTLKDGHYTFSYRPTTPGEFIVSIKVSETPIMGSPFTLTVKSKPGPDYTLQHSSGRVKVSVWKGDITTEQVDVNAGNTSGGIDVKANVEVSTGTSFRSSVAKKGDKKIRKSGPSTIYSVKGDVGDTTDKKEEVVTSVLQHDHKFEGVTLKVEPYLDSKLKNDDQQFEVFEVVSAEGDVNQKSLQLAVASERTDAHEMDTGDRSSITNAEVQSFEIQPKIAKVFVRAHKKDLDDIETEFQVEIPRQIDGKIIRVKPKETCSVEGYGEACTRFINLYQQMYQRVKMERFSLKREKLIVRSREVISRTGKMFPVLIELKKDRKHYELYGEESHIAEALQYLEEEGVEIKNETKKYH